MLVLGPSAPGASDPAGRPLGHAGPCPHSQPSALSRPASTLTVPRASLLLYQGASPLVPNTQGTEPGAQRSLSSGVHRGGPAAGVSSSPEPRRGSSTLCRQGTARREQSCCLPVRGGRGLALGGGAMAGAGPQVRGRPLPFALGGGRGPDCTSSQSRGGRPGTAQRRGRGHPKRPPDRVSERVSSTTQRSKRPEARDREERPSPSPRPLLRSLVCGSRQRAGAGGTRKPARAVPGRGARGGGGGGRA